MASTEQPPIFAGTGLSHNSSEDHQDEKQATEDGLTQDETPDDTFPEGGARAWLVAIGTAGIAFCTLGYVNSFGLVP